MHCKIIMKIATGYSSHIKTNQENKKPSKWKWRASESAQITHFRSNSFPRIRSIQPMLGTGNDIFLVSHFVWLDVERAQRCASELYVSSGAGIIIENIWQGILRLFPRIELLVFLGYPESIGKIRKCSFDRISNPLERKTLYVPPSPSEICLF